MVAYMCPQPYADLVKMPGDGERREVTGGELFVNPAPRRADQKSPQTSTCCWLSSWVDLAQGASIHPGDVYIDIS